MSLESDEGNFQVGEEHGKVSVFTLQKITGGEVSHFDQVAIVLKHVYKLWRRVCVSHRESAGCRGQAAPRQPSLQEPGSAEEHINMMQK